jgi:hypothetical protein
LFPTLIYKKRQQQQQQQRGPARVSLVACRRENKTKQKVGKQKAHHLDETAAAAAAAAAAHCVHVCVSIDSWMQIGSADSRRGQKTREREAN